MHVVQRGAPIFGSLLHVVVHFPAPVAEVSENASQRVTSFNNKRGQNLNENIIFPSLNTEITRKNSGAL